MATTLGMADEFVLGPVSDCWPPRAAQKFEHVELCMSAIL
jgi:hypothetical protein